MKQFLFEHAYTPEGWKENLLVETDIFGQITSMSSLENFDHQEAEREPGEEVPDQDLLPAAVRGLPPRPRGVRGRVLIWMFVQIGDGNLFVTRHFDVLFVFVCNIMRPFVGLFLFVLIV